MSGRTKEAIVDTRVNKVLALRADSAALLEALDSIGEFYVHNTVDARRALRQDLEKQNILSADSFVNKINEITNQIDVVKEKSHNLESSCHSLASHVAEADRNMKSFMETATNLENKRTLCLTQAQEVDAFLRKFQLSAAEVDTLYHGKLDYLVNSKEFFKALNRLLIAFKDCEAIVELNTYSVASVELLDMLGNHKNVAYSRLFDWVKSKCEGLNDNHVPLNPSSYETDETLQIAIKYLRSIPVYYDQCVDLIVSSRRGLVVQKFIMALTQGDPDSHGRAIDLYAHDSGRYIGDMLSWMHQTMVSEKEFLTSLFESSYDRDSALSSVEKNSVAPMQVATSEMLSRCLQGLGRPLRARIIQTLEIRNSSVETLYAIADILCFYEAQFSRIIKEENAVHSAVKGCYKECRKIFGASLNRQASSVSSSILTYSVDLAPVFMTKECAKQLREILAVYGSLMSSLSADRMIADFEDSGESLIENECHIDNVLGAIIQPILQAVRSCSNQSLEGADAAVFMLNNVTTLQTELKSCFSASQMGREATSTWIELLDTEIQTWTDVVVREESARTLKRSDLDMILDLIEVLPSSLVASEQPGLTPDRLNNVLKSFYSSVFTTVVISAYIEKLVDTELRTQCRARIANNVVEKYEIVFNFVSNPANKYDAQILTHSVDEIGVLLGYSKN